MSKPDFTSFEPLQGTLPDHVLDRHPDGRLIACQAYVGQYHDKARACVWDNATGKLMWAPDNVMLLAWLPAGDRIAAIHESYQRSPDHPAIIGSPLQSEFTYSLVLQTWPEHVELGRCRLTFPTGWPVELVVSPSGGLAVVKWVDQGESGFEVVDLSGSSPQQIMEPGVSPLEPLTLGVSDKRTSFRLNTNISGSPVFSPDDRYIVLAWDDEWKRRRRGNAGVDEQGSVVLPASPGGELTVGTLSIIDWETRTHTTIPVTADVPAGGRQALRDGDGTWPFSPAPNFVDATHFTLNLPTGTVRTFSVEG